MPDEEEDPRSRAARYRDTAATLRQFADQVQFDARRYAQLRALADGFERAAQRIEAPTRCGG